MKLLTEIIGSTRNGLYYRGWLMHDIRNRKVPSNILNLLSDTTSIHSYNTRSSTENNSILRNLG